MSNEVDEGWIFNLMAMVRDVLDTCVGGTFFFQRRVIILNDELRSQQTDDGILCPGEIEENKRKKNKADQTTTVT